MGGGGGGGAICGSFFGGPFFLNFLCLLWCADKNNKINWMIVAVCRRRRSGSGGRKRPSCGVTSECVCVCLSVGRSVWLSVCLSVCLSVGLSVCLSVCLFVCLSVPLSVPLSVCLARHRQTDIQTKLGCISLRTPLLTHPHHNHINTPHTAKRSLMKDEKMESNKTRAATADVSAAVELEEDFM
jgi:hypothetical protein